MLRQRRTILFLSLLTAALYFDETRKKNENMNVQPDEQNLKNLQQHLLNIDINNDE